jgi:toxin HigB-1
MAIISFADKIAEDFFYTGKASNKFGWFALKSVLRRKLDILDYAEELIDLRSPPGNRLEELKGDLRGYYSIRVNDQWRIIFIWTLNGPKNVQIADYHD